MPTAEKAVKKRDRTQMPVAKKERTDQRPNHKCWWPQTKNGCPNQSSKQLTPNERNKTAETTSKSQTVAYLQRLQQSNRLLSATKEWTTTVRRAQSKNNCANDRWKAKLTITNSKLTPHLPGFHLEKQRLQTDSIKQNADKDYR